MSLADDTIAAIATPPGRGGVGVIRVSGEAVPRLAKKLLHKQPADRHATSARFYARNGQILDDGIAIYFKKPRSFTGEHVLELQGHGGPVVMDRLLKEVLSLGARMATPGEFSQRAFLNDKLDLAQAEAVADLIESASEEAAQAALRTLRGDFSEVIRELVEQLTELRVYVEASLDFPDEEIDEIAYPEIKYRAQELLREFLSLREKAQQGVRLQEGLKVAIVGRPNAGKSSLLNRLAAQEIAIVADVPGTTRDVLRQTIYLGGAPIQLVDTAGLRDTSDIVEKEGVRRAQAAMVEADLILLVIDSSFDTDWRSQIEELSRSPNAQLVIVFNKMDLVSDEDSFMSTDYPTLCISSLTGENFDQLQACLQRHLGLISEAGGCFSARRRHLDALDRAEHALRSGHNDFEQHRATELFAEELKLAQHQLGLITGEVTPDDLLGKIFSSFCIGK